jgi:predicted RNA polymerase sigma factor
MSEFVYLYRGGERPSGSPEQMQQQMQKWMTWMKELGDKGHIKDRSQWDPDLVAEGQRLLDLSATGSELSEYHIEAAIAAVHANAHRAEDTNWGQIVALYDTLMTIRLSPVVALNRAIAVAQHEGPERGLQEIRAITGRDRLASYPFYFAALGELELRCDRHDSAREHFQAALALARNPMERRFLEQRITACNGLTATK